ncbi:MAG TPA: right-handed parallel beta-helix repeat-containing protein [Marmoricola sp.]|nr:right-handed parallel beta-helix repeat-containing protein [Marmoricola sp.]
MIVFGRDLVHSNRVRLMAATAAILMIVGGLAGSATASPDHGRRVSVFVSAHRGHDTSTCGTSRHPCATITQGLSRAASGAVVRVLPGRYHELVVMTQRARLVGFRATINAAGLSSGTGMAMIASAVTVTPPASGSTVEGFRVTGAYGEGILVAGAHHVRIAQNHVFGNDVGTPASTSYFECQAQGEVPGDCGEGIHLMSAMDSTVARNRIDHNSGGILVTDELGPASGNRILRNRVVNNPFDCGITMPGHNPNALASNGTRQPTVAGVHDNLVEGNIIVANGLRGEGAGVLIAAAMPGAASYDNRIVGNVIRRNDLAGVTMHAHAPNQDINDNVIARNTIGRNNLGGDPDAGVTQTTGILIYSALPTVTVHVTVRHNHIHGNVFPIWKSSNVTIN